MVNFKEHQVQQHTPPGAVEYLKGLILLWQQLKIKNSMNITKRHIDGLKIFRIFQSLKSYHQ